jgi:pyruvate carboxylase
MPVTISTISLFIGIIAGVIYYIDGWGPTPGQKDLSSSKRYQGLATVIGGGIISPILDKYLFETQRFEFFQGYLGQPYQGFPKELQQIILKGREAITTRPGERLDPVNFQKITNDLSQQFNRQVTDHEVLSYALYSKVFLDYTKLREQFGDLSTLDTPTFFYGMRAGEEINVKIEQGKTLFVKLVSIGEPQKDGTRSVYYELNGKPREVTVQDLNIETSNTLKAKADKTNAEHIGATMPGTVIKVLVEKGTKVKKGDHLAITEAMKMETTVQAPFSGVVKDIYVHSGEGIQTGDLLIELDK